MATDSAARSIQVGLPELLQVFYAQYLSSPNQRGEGFAISIASPFSPSEPEALNEASSYWAFLKEASTVLLLGAVCRCISPDSEKGLTILLVFIMSRSTSIWYLLETFQSWLKQRRFFCSLEPLALPALNPFKCERRAQPCLRNEIADSAGWLSR